MMKRQQIRHRNVEEEVKMGAGLPGIHSSSHSFSFCLFLRRVGDAAALFANSFISAALL